MFNNPTPVDSPLIDERSVTSFRQVFGDLLSRSTRLDTAMLRVRLSGVDLSEGEVGGLERLRLLVAEVSAQTLEEEAFALLSDPEKRGNLTRVLALLQAGRMELRSAPLAGWSPDFSVFSGPQGPLGLILGLHWIQRPFPHRGPAWGATFGPEEAKRGGQRFQEIWDGAHEIGPAIRRLLERATKRWEADRPPSLLEGVAPPPFPFQGKPLGEKG
jgi:hypothetical protein